MTPQEIERLSVALYRIQMELTDLFVTIGELSSKKSADSGEKRPRLRLIKEGRADGIDEIPLHIG